jgi:hypothetical protein
MDGWMDGLIDVVLRPRFFRVSESVESTRKKIAASENPISNMKCKFAIFHSEPNATIVLDHVGASPHDEP